MFIISEPINDEPSSIGNGSTIGFLVPDEETGNAWHQAGLDNGGETCEDPPGVRDVKKLMGTNMYLISGDPSEISYIKEWTKYLISCCLSIFSSF